MKYYHYVLFNEGNNFLVEGSVQEFKVFAFDLLRESDPLIPLLFGCAYRSIWQNIPVSNIISAVQYLGYHVGIEGRLKCDEG